MNASTRGLTPISATRGRSAGAIDTQDSHTTNSERGAQGSADERQDDALDHQLTNQLAPAGPDTQPNGDLLGASAGPAERQVGDVRHGNQQDERHGAGQNPQ